MQRVTFHVPLFDNNGNATPVRQIEKELLDKFNGFTVIRDVEGYWVSPDGRVCADEQVLYLVDLNIMQTHAQTWRWLEKKKEEWQMLCGQQSLYVTVQEIQIL